MQGDMGPVSVMGSTWLLKKSDGARLLRDYPVVGYVWNYGVGAPNLQ
jgi:hypothetical protein